MMVPLAAAAIALGSPPPRAVDGMDGAAAGRPDPPAYIRVAHLSAPDGGADGFAALRAMFRERNPGYDIHFAHSVTELGAADGPRIVFVQRGAARVVAGDQVSPVDVGDLLALRAGMTLECDAPLDLVAFRVPGPLPRALPAFVRPDWDERITDTPGGCATETGAYRRILLTWLPSVGPYVFHGLNAHRVRITDSFTHYHPVDGGFDEFYLVQMVQPDARLIVSDRTDDIVARDGVTADDARELLDEVPLEVGDLVYLPRGVVHRGIDGVLAQVITTPGFRPGAEVGVDHHLRAIAEATGVDLPYHAAGSEQAIVK